MRHFTSILTLSVYAQAWSDSGFFVRKEEGWFWYQNPPLVEEPAAPEERYTPDSEEPFIALSPSLAESETGHPLSSAWLSHNLPQYLNAALDDPSPANVAVYLYLQRYALDKASRFADSAEMMVMGDPFLDENTRRPIATFGAQLRTRASAEALDSVLSVLAEQAGLYFFFRSDCPYSYDQVSILQALQNGYGFRTMAVSLDHLPLPGNPYPEYVVDQGQAQLLGVIATPALFLVKPQPDREIVQISQGLLSLSELRDRIVKLAHGSGWIDDTEFHRTQPFDSVLMASGHSPEFPDEAVLRDPEQLIQYIRDQLGR